MELKQYLSVIAKWWWLLVASVLVATLASYLALSNAPRIYEATTTIRVGQALEKANPTYQDFSISQELAQTYMNMVTRTPVLDGAAKSLGLAFVPDSKDVSARLIAGTQFLEISVRDTDPERARALANAIAQQLILQTPNEVAKDQARQVFVQEQLEWLQGSIQATVEELRIEQEALDAADSARAIEEHQSNIQMLEEKLAEDQATYASLLQSVEGRTNYITVFEEASAPARPISPREIETLLLAAAIGLILALAGAFLIEFTDNTVKSTQDLRETSGLPVLGTIARVPANLSESQLIVQERPRSSIAEAYRVMRTNILLSSADDPIRTLMVSSPGQLEGKSTVTANLAAVVAQSGQKVVLIDVDLRRSTQHRILEVPNEKGVTSVFIQDEPSLSAYLQETKVEGLSVLTSGPLPPNPSELLGSQKMEHLIKRAREQTDLVLFDTPPVLPITDAAVLASKVDAVLLVADSGRTRRPAIQQAVESLQQVEANIIGTILNRAHPGQSYGYGSYFDAEAHPSDQKLRRRWYRRVPVLGRLLAR
jgi:capsular exopolysaccharide synthesis family protein